MSKIETFFFKFSEILMPKTYRNDSGTSAGLEEYFQSRRHLHKTNTAVHVRFIDSDGEEQS